MLRELVERRPGRSRRDAWPRCGGRSVRVEGTVQGVGFRPYVYRLAGELGLAGFVLNDARGVLLEVEGDDARGRALPGPAAAEAPPLARGRAGGRRGRVEPSGAARLRDRRERRAAGAPTPRSPPDTATCDDCLRRAVRPGRPPLPLPVHQLHQLRPAVHDRARRPLRPAADDDGRVRDVRRAAGPSTRTRPTAASTPSRTRARPAGRGALLEPTAASAVGGERDAVAAAAAALRDGAIVAVKGIGGYHLACRADDERGRGARCARASTARTSRSR